MTHKKVWRYQMLLIMRDEQWERNPQKVAEVRRLARLLEQIWVPNQRLEDLKLEDYESWLSSGYPKLDIARLHDVSLATLGRYIKKLREQQTIS
ncbi:hypothetical protein [uncultured Vagococcus sp.]|uniref:hypothetical protein n=1 Tax=uncultured Vagococcus sp. TaxID=189676 RepID=UPI0028D4D997|nr:hypothetical protein [uncultured Vagococcus sp.]